MAQSHKEAQLDLFDAHEFLDDKNIVGVFYFSDAAKTLDEKIRFLDAQVEHLTTVRGLIEKQKITAGAAPKIAPSVRWLSWQEAVARQEREKMLMQKQSDSESTPDSTPDAAAENYHEKNHSGAR